MSDRQLENNLDYIFKVKLSRRKILVVYKYGSAMLAGIIDTSRHNVCMLLIITHRIAFTHRHFI